MTIHLKYLGLQDYPTTCNSMREFSVKRGEQTDDQIWFLEHFPVYTLGLAGKTRHLLNTVDIPVVKTDRGGQVTYHGPGQLIAYLLIDLHRRPYAIKQFVALIEESIMHCLRDFGVTAERQSGAPGIYINGEKIAALGVRIKKGCTYHGLALNVDMDLRPFAGINPCGYEGMVCTQLIDHKQDIQFSEVKTRLSNHLLNYLDINRDVLSDVAC